MLVQIFMIRSDHKDLQSKRGLALKAEPFSEPNTSWLLVLPFVARCVLLVLLCFRIVWFLVITNNPFEGADRECRTFLTAGY